MMEQETKLIDDKANKVVNRPSELLKRTQILDEKPSRSKEKKQSNSKQKHKAKISTNKMEQKTESKLSINLKILEQRQNTPLKERKQPDKNKDDQKREIWKI